MNVVQRGELSGQAQPQLPELAQSSGKRKRVDGEHQGRVKWLRAMKPAHSSPTQKSRAALLHLMRCNPRVGHHLGKLSRRFAFSQSVLVGRHQQREASALHVHQQHSSQQ